MRNTRKNSTQPFSASQTAALALLLCERGVTTLKSGYCVGDLRCVDLYVKAGQLLRVAHHSKLFTVRYRVRFARHQQAGHDAGCQTLGVPITTMSALCAGWGGVGVQALLCDALTATLKRIMAVSASAERTCENQPHNYEIFAVEVSRRIEPDFGSLELHTGRSSRHKSADHLSKDDPRFQSRATFT